MAFSTFLRERDLRHYLTRAVLFEPFFDPEAPFEAPSPDAASLVPFWLLNAFARSVKGLGCSSGFRGVEA